MTHLCEYFFNKKSLFQRITSFRSIFQIYAFWVPISAVEGPHWVPISLKIRSPLGPHEKYFGSPLNVGAVGLEALNKFILRMRSRGARKDSTLNNFTDTYNHLWDRSRPIIVEMERVIKRRPAKLKVSTEIESMVESMFAEEED